MSRDAETKPLLAKDREGWLYAMPILGVLNLVAGVDAMLLPGSLLATQRDLGFTPESLGMLQLAQSCGFSVGIYACCNSKLERIVLNFFLCLTCI